jgi:hypothetical protein
VTAVDVDTLPATQYLILEVLAARHRTGESRWPFPSRLRPAVRALSDAGLVDWKSGTVSKTIQVWLTPAGRAAMLSDTYRPPNVPMPDLEVAWADFRDGVARTLDPVWKAVAGAIHRASLDTQESAPTSP